MSYENFDDFRKGIKHGTFEKISPMVFENRLEVWVARILISDTNFWNVLENGLTKRFIFEQWSKTESSDFARAATFKTDEFDKVRTWIKNGGK